MIKVALQQFLTTHQRQIGKLAFAGSFLILGIGIGWLCRPLLRPVPATPPTKTALRLSGYDLVSPILLYDSIFTGNTPKLNPLQKKIEDVIHTGEQEGDIAQASVYFRDLKTGYEININDNEKFFPASLKKVPIMMEVYKQAESDPSILTAKKVLTGSKDYNADAAIPPKEVPQYGNEYSPEELIDYMIKYSDNNSYEALFNSMGSKKFDQIFQDMQLHYPDTSFSVDDYITPYQFSLFFRTLYNATYLSATASEKALELLSQADYKNGLVAGVPAATTVAHKFGVAPVPQDNGITEGELHDCGIVYPKQNPYLICVMTKSVAQIPQVEKVIASISGAAYAAADANYQ